MKNEDNKLGKVASECADKLRGIESVIPPNIPKETFWDRAEKAIEKIAEGFRPYPPIPFEEDSYDRMLDLAAVVAMASGFVAFGMAIGATIR